MKGDSLERFPQSDLLTPTIGMTDAPGLGAVVFAKAQDPRRSSGIEEHSIRVMVRRDNGFLESALIPEDFDSFMSMVALEDPDRVVVRTRSREWLTRFGSKHGGGLQPFTLDWPAWLSNNAKGSYLSSVDRYVQMGPTRGFQRCFQEFTVKHLGPERYEEIPGDAVESQFDSTAFVGVTEVPWRRVAILAAKQGLYVYDGAGISRIPASDPDALGEHAGMFALPSIRKVIVATTRDVFDLSADGQLTRIAVPAREAGFTWVSEMPGSRLGLIAHESGIYSLDVGGDIRLIPGTESEVWSSPAFTGVIPPRSEMLVGAQPGLYLIVDRSLQGSAGCATR